MLPLRLGGRARPDRFDFGFERPDAPLTLVLALALPGPRPVVLAPALVPDADEVDAFGFDLDPVSRPVDPVEAFRSSDSAMAEDLVRADDFVRLPDFGLEPDPDSVL